MYARAVSRGVLAASAPPRVGGADRTPGGGPPDRPPPVRASAKWPRGYRPSGRGGIGQVAAPGYGQVAAGLSAKWTSPRRLCPRPASTNMCSVWRNPPTPSSTPTRRSASWTAPRRPMRWPPGRPSWGTRHWRSPTTTGCAVARVRPRRPGGRGAADHRGRGHPARGRPPDAAGRGRARVRQPLPAPHPGPRRHAPPPDRRRSAAPRPSPWPPTPRASCASPGARARGWCRGSWRAGPPGGARGGARPGARPSARGTSTWRSSAPARAATGGWRAKLAGWPRRRRARAWPPATPTRTPPSAPCCRTRSWRSATA